MHVSLTYESIIHYIQMIADIVFVWIVIDYLIKVVRASQKTIQIFQGVILIIIIQAISKVLGLTTVSWLTSNIISWGFLAIIVIFQPEIRSILERLGKSNALARITTLTSSEKEKLIDELMTATANLASSKTGALITLERSTSLVDFVNTGIKLNSVVSAELLCSIFQTTTPLHDGAVIIQGDKLACASAYFPPTTMELPSKYGARHRAAFGISEITDSVTIVVSEETGTVSLAEGGTLIQMNDKKLRDYLEKIILNKENVSSSSYKTSNPNGVSVDSIIKNANKDEKKENSTPNKEMKIFQTQSFRTVDLESVDESDSNPSEFLKNIISSGASENSVDKKVVIRTVSVPRDKESDAVKTTIKTNSVTTGTDKIDTPSEKEESTNG